MGFLKLYDSRFFWFFLFIIPLSFVIFSHTFFQNFLYMQPCTLCVYIRFYMLMITFFAIFAWIDPENFIFSLVSFFGTAFATFMGLFSSYKLYTIKHQTSQLFGSTCGETPNFFGFDLTIFPIFVASGDCVYDAPVLPEFARPRNLQEFFINFYDEGWYLIPQYKFIDMSEFCLGFFGLILSVLALNFISQIFYKSKAKYVASQFNKKPYFKKRNIKQSKKIKKEKEEEIQRDNLPEKQSQINGNVKNDEVEEKTEEKVEIDQNLNQEVIPSIFDDKQNLENFEPEKNENYEILEEKQKNAEFQNLENSEKIEPKQDLQQTQESLNDELFSKKRKIREQPVKKSFFEDLIDKIKANIDNIRGQ